MWLHSLMSTTYAVTWIVLVRKMMCPWRMLLFPRSIIVLPCLYLWMYLNYVTILAPPGFMDLRPHLSLIVRRGGPCPVTLNFQLLLGCTYHWRPRLLLVCMSLRRLYCPPWSNFSSTTSSPIAASHHERSPTSTFYKRHPWRKMGTLPDRLDLMVSNNPRV